MKFEFTKPDLLLFKPENEYEIFQLGFALGKNEMPYQMRVSGETGVKADISDIAISAKDLWFWLRKPKELRKNEQ